MNKQKSRSPMYIFKYLTCKISSMSGSYCSQSGELKKDLTYNIVIFLSLRKKIFVSCFNKIWTFFLIFIQQPKIVLCKDVKVLQLDLSITHMNKCVIIKQKAMNIRQLFRGRRRMQQRIRLISHLHKAWHPPKSWQSNSVVTVRKRMLKSASFLFAYENK